VDAEGHADWEGLALVAVTSVALAYALFLTGCGLYRMQRSLTGAHMLWSDDSRAVTLHRPRYADGYHVFLSYDASDWGEASYIKRKLTTLVPTMEIFLHRDDMHDASLLEKHVQESNVFVVMISSHYLAMANCRRELVAALAEERPILILVDEGPPKRSSGAVTPNELRAQAHRLSRSGESTPDEDVAMKWLVSILESNNAAHTRRVAINKEVAELKRQPGAHTAAAQIQAVSRGRRSRMSSNSATPEPHGGSEWIAGNIRQDHFVEALPDELEWHRDERRFTDVVLKTILAKATAEEPKAQRRATRLSQLSISDETPFRVPPTGLGIGVHIPALYRELAPTAQGSNAPSLFEELAFRLSAHGIRVHQTTTAGAPTVFLVCPELYDRPDLVCKLVDLLPELDHTRETKRGAARRQSISKAVSAAVRSTVRRASIMQPSRSSIRQTRRGSTVQPRRGSAMLSQANVPGRTSLGSSDGDEAFLGLYSTASTLSWYGSNCPQQLSGALSLSSIEFDKWPLSTALQDAAAIAIAKELLKSSNGTNSVPDAEPPRLPAPYTSSFFGMRVSYGRSRRRASQDLPIPRMPSINAPEELLGEEDALAQSPSPGYSPGPHEHAAHSSPNKRSRPSASRHKDGSRRKDSFFEEERVGHASAATRDSPGRLTGSRRQAPHVV